MNTFMKCFKLRLLQGQLPPHFTKRFPRTTPVSSPNRPLAIAKAAQEKKTKLISRLEDAFRHAQRDADIAMNRYHHLMEEKRNLLCRNEQLQTDLEMLRKELQGIDSENKSIRKDLYNSHIRRATLAELLQKLRSNFRAEVNRFHGDNENLRTSMATLTEEKNNLQSENEKLRIKVASAPIQIAPHNREIRDPVELSRSPVNDAERESGIVEVSTASNQVDPTFRSPDLKAGKSIGPISERWRRVFGPSSKIVGVKSDPSILNN